MKFETWSCEKQGHLYTDVAECIICGWAETNETDVPGGPKAYWSHFHRCWFVPVSKELMDAPEFTRAEPARVELKDGELWITQLDEGGQ